MIPRLQAIAAMVALLTLPARPAWAQGVTERRDLVYASPGGRPLYLDAYLPTSDDPVPGLIVIYGGKWIAGDKRDHSDVAMYFAQQGFAAFAIDYRSAERDPFPAAVRDVRAAARWVRERASELQVDPEKLGAVGWSAGGHLAASLATFGEGSLEDGSRISAAVSWSGPMDLPPLFDSPFPEVRTAVTSFLDCDQGSTCQTLAERASPIEHVDPSDAPLYLANGSDELIPADQATSMAEAMDRAGVPYVLREIPGRSHGLGYAANSKMFGEAVDFFRAWLGGRQTTDDTGGGPESGTGGSSTATPLKPVAEAPQGSEPSKPLPLAEPVPRSTDSGVPLWTVVLVAIGVLALVLSGFQLWWAQRAMRSIRAAQGEGIPDDYALRRTEDTPPTP